jgi:transposase InsO family protein
MNIQLKREVFMTLKEAKILVERWRYEYNHIRPHSSLGYRPTAVLTDVLAEKRRMCRVCAALIKAGAPIN